MSDDPLLGPKSKIERANSHIGDLVAADKAFFETKPYALFKETNAEGTEDTYKLRFTNPALAQISAIVGDVIHNLRSALDLACCLAVKNGQSDTGGTYFPFGRSKHVFEFPDTQLKIKKLSPEAAALVRGLEPYQGGNDLLWSLHELDIIDKHRALVSVTAVRGGDIIGNTRITGLREGLNFVEIPQWSPFDEEIAYLRLPAGAKVNGDLKLPLTMVFREPDPVKGKQVIGTLRQLASLAQSILLIVETRFYPEYIGTSRLAQSLTVQVRG
jgi:hypothetical protein